MSRGQDLRVSVSTFLRDRIMAGVHLRHAMPKALMSVINANFPCNLSVLTMARFAIYRLVQVR